jgi:hypothetical protein
MKNAGPTRTMKMELDGDVIWTLPAAAATVILAVGAARGERRRAWLA